MEKNGGPAFPLTEDAISYRNREFDMQGMSLRDYFAGKAMEKMEWAMFVGLQETNDSLDRDARRCYRISDAMLKAREGK